MINRQKNDKKTVNWTDEKFWSSRGGSRCGKNLKIFEIFPTGDNNASFTAVHVSSDFASFFPRSQITLQQRRQAISRHIWVRHQEICSKYCCAFASKPVTKIKSENGDNFESTYSCHQSNEGRFLAAFWLWKCKNDLLTNIYIIYIV